LQQLVEAIDRELYKEFENQAKERLRDRDERDWPVLATALGLTCPIWTEDADFFGTGIAVWTTSRIEIFLKAQVKSSEPIMQKIPPAKTSSLPIASLTPIVYAKHGVVRLETK